MPLLFAYQVYKQAAHLKHFACWVIVHAFFVICWLFLKNIECQAVWIQLRADILSGLIWILTVCKGYQQATQAGNIVQVLSS